MSHPVTEARAIDSNLDSEIVLHQALDGPGLVVDVGANIGSFARPMAREPGMRVLAFEPMPVVAEQLRLALAEDAKAGNSRAELHCMALSDYAGRVRLSIPVGPEGWVIHQCGSIAKDWAAIRRRYPQDMAPPIEVDVEVATLDSFALQDVCGLKIDVEGAELSVLRGARDTLERCRPFLSLELEERHAPGCVEAVPAFLAGLGYEGFFILDGRVHPLGALQLPAMQRGSVSPACQQFSDPYIYQFYFVHRSQPQRRDALFAQAPHGFVPRVPAEWLGRPDIFR